MCSLIIGVLKLKMMLEKLYLPVAGREGDVDWSATLHLFEAAVKNMISIMAEMKKHSESYKNYFIAFLFYYCGE